MGPWTLVQPDGLKITDRLAVNNFCWSMLLMDKDGQKAIVLGLPAVYDDGTPVPFMNADGSGIHDDLPVFVRTYVLTALQGRTSRKKSLVAMAFNQAAAPKLLPEGLAVVVKDKRK